MRTLSTSFPKSEYVDSVAKKWLRTTLELTGLSGNLDRYVLVERRESGTSVYFKFVLQE